MAVPEATTALLGDTTAPAPAGPPADVLDGQPIIALDGRSGRITVRALRYSDAEPMHKLCDNHKIWVNMRDRFPRPYTIDAAYQWITLCRSPESWHSTGFVDTQGKAASTKLPTAWAIAIDDKIVGGMGLMFGTDTSRRCAELGYWVGEPYWGQGIVTHVARAFVDWTLKTYPYILRIEANVYAWNKPSQRVLEKLGFIYEGTKKAAVYKDGKVTDIVEFAFVRPEKDWTISIDT